MGGSGGEKRRGARDCLTENGDIAKAPSPVSLDGDLVALGQQCGLLSGRLVDHQAVAQGVIGDVSHARDPRDPRLAVVRRLPQLGLSVTRPTGPRYLQWWLRGGKRAGARGRSPGAAAGRPLGEGIEECQAQVQQALQRRSGEGSGRHRL